MNRMIQKVDRILDFLYYYIPEGMIKKLTRKVGFQLSNYLPYGIMVNKGETVIEIGTPFPKNVERFRKLIGSKGKLIVIEPEPRNVKNLRNYITKKKWKNVILIEKAAWSEEKIINFKVSIGGSGHKIPIENVLIDNDFDPNWRYINDIDVEAIPLDNLLEFVKQVDYIYITVNGAELEVLKGALKILKTLKPRLWVKAHALIDNRPLNEKIANFLNSLGYHTIITASSKGIVEGWEKRAGDVYAWKNT